LLWQVAELQVLLWRVAEPQVLQVSQVLQQPVVRTAQVVGRKPAP
jgi:hypothetical protein